MQPSAPPLPRGPGPDMMTLAFLQSPIAHLVTRHRRVVECNRALEALFQVDRQALIGCSMRKLYPSNADFTEIGARCEKALLTRTSYSDERFMQTGNGDVFWTRAWGATLTPGNPFAFMIWGFERVAARAGGAAALSAREKQVANHVANGRTSKEIGQLLGISHRTVEVHKANLMRKLGARNSAGLVSGIVQTSGTDDEA